MQCNESFRKVIIDKFNYDPTKYYQPEQKYINGLIASLARVDMNSYAQYPDGFISECKYLLSEGVLPSIKAFVDGCLYQLIWINTILESGKYATTDEDLEQEFDYKTPTMLGDPWTLDKVTKKGVYFSGDELFQDSVRIINSENITEIAIALYTVLEENKIVPVKSAVPSGSKAKESSLFKSIELETECLNVLKELKHPVLDVDGKFLNRFGMKGAIVIWHYHCEVFGYIPKNIFSSRDILAKAVMNIIPNLSIDGSSFGRIPKAMRYKDEIEQKLEQILKK